MEHYSKFLPAGSHYAVDYPGGVCVVETGQPETEIKVDGVGIGRQCAEGSCKTAECIRIALQHIDPELDWSEGSEAWGEVVYELRDGVIRAPVPEASEVGEAAEDWWDALGYTTSDYTDDTEDSRIGEAEGSHPVCDFAEVETYDAEGPLERALLKYAKTAKEAALSLRAALDEAHAAAKAGNPQDLVQALLQAYRIETEYGDEPSTDSAAKALLGDGWKLSYNGRGVIWDRV